MKKWWTSKTLWANAIAIAAIVIQGLSGKDLVSPEMQVAILGALNIFLRLITKEEIEW